ncbi:MAG: GNAT family N-acetyltransferase [Bacteroidetes bacterium GWF2_42_66]|nr:MAG: GNAT family N-acetyltransferase [Bacteroidetes bacterium GWA2_42_15]OFX99394.1 MAG: GNAT family N-acetyltransferase [Bacteroidetes bacterium GWE2_42_39]OFY40446.1 MAG: GNAT family N-acetyltransferase [Bacteroidetes bacterium GWF2_42_66]HBL76933.1 GNAT family N-acetyltransferase [Prolixibacteraceae bacterium]HCR91321.1 GNAT family N-acetyltransferase [Prolixibacteraceae bacterium]
MTEKSLKDIQVVTATVVHLKYVDQVNDEIDAASKERGTGIARRTYDYIANKMLEGKAVIALDGDQFAGFCYLESWGHNRFVANSGLIVAKAYRSIGLATEIKRKIFNLSRMKFPDAKIFGLTTGLAVMKINHELGYRPVTFSELTDDEDFWKGCQSCVNYDILQRTNRSKCLCTGMLFDPKWEAKKPVNGNPAPEESQIVKPKRNSLLDVIQKLKPKNGNNQVKESKFNVLMTILSKI